MAYRISRNIEASIIDKITADILSDWSTFNIRVEKSFTQVYEGTLPCICVNALEIRPKKLEIGSKTNLKYFTVNVRIFATNDGMRLDLADYFTDKFEDDINYYTYTIVNGVVSTKVLAGRIVITRWFDNKKELTNTETLEKEDRYRHILTFECIVAD